MKKQNAFPCKFQKKSKMTRISLSKMCRSQNICEVVELNKNPQNPL